MFADRGPADRVHARHVLPTPAGWTGDRFSLGFRVTEAFLALIALSMTAGAVWAYLADEPVASLDPATSHSVMKYLELLNKEDGITILCSLHFLSLARAYAGTRTLRFADGPDEVHRNAIAKVELARYADAP